VTSETSTWAARAVDHLTRAASGRPLDRSVRVTLNFHPDRVVAGATVLERLGRDGVYRSQFEIGTSNGGLSAHPSGARSPGEPEARPALEPAR
jgi:hypothetical protein